MPLGRRFPGDKIPYGGRGFPRYAQKRPGGYTVAFATIASIASCDHIILDAHSALTYGDYVINCIRFLSTIEAGITISD